MMSDEHQVPFSTFSIAAAPMGDIKNHRLIIAKGLLFVLLGILASVLLLIRVPSMTNAVLHAIAVWAFCRFYYFAFYVIERYVDPDYKFAGLGSFVAYLVRSRFSPTSRDIHS